MEERKSGGKCGYLLASPLAAAAGFHGLPALAAAWENGSRSRINLLLAGRTQATAPSSPSPTRGAAPTPRFGGSERCEYRKHSSGLCRRWERGDGGVPGSGGFSERSLTAQKGQGLGVLPGCGPASWRLQSLGAARDLASLQPAPRLPGWSSHLWESLALGLWLLSLIRNPTEGGHLPLGGGQMQQTS